MTLQQLLCTIAALIGYHIHLYLLFVLSRIVSRDVYFIIITKTHANACVFVIKVKYPHSGIVSKVRYFNLFNKKRTRMRAFLLKCDITPLRDSLQSEVFHPFCHPTHANACVR